MYSFCVFIDRYRYNYIIPNQFSSIHSNSIQSFQFNLIGSIHFPSIRFTTGKRAIGIRAAAALGPIIRIASIRIVLIGSFELNWIKLSGLN